MKIFKGFFTRREGYPSKRVKVSPGHTWKRKVVPSRRVIPNTCEGKTTTKTSEGPPDL